MKQLSPEAFVDACGGQGPLCLEVTPPSGRACERQLLNQPFALLGRDLRADVCLKDPGVSRQHALVQMIAGRVFCLDLGSRTGTHWNGGAAGHGWLAGEAALRVGPYQLCVTEQQVGNLAAALDDWDPWARGSLARGDFPSCTLHFSNDGTTVRQWRMNRVLAIVGTANVCKVRLRGPGVSRLHCSLVCTPDGVWVIDLRRQGGVHVNDIRVGYALLEDGDQLQVGNYTIRVRYDRPASLLRTMPASAPAASLLSGPGDPRTENELLQCGADAPNRRGLSRSAETAMTTPSLSGHSGAISAGPWSADLLSGVLRQFSDTQHQMFEQSMAMMFQMFRTMHVEQVGVLREELERLDELNQELRSLLTERLKEQSAPALAPSPALLSGRGASATSTSNGRPISVSALKQPPAEPAAAAGNAPTSPRNPAGSPPPVQASSAAPAGQDVHLWLCQRMEAIQQERHGIWERIVGTLKKSEG